MRREEVVVQKAFRPSDFPPALGFDWPGGFDPEKEARIKLYSHRAMSGRPIFPEDTSVSRNLSA